MKGSDLEGLLDKLPSKYAMTMAVAQRAKQLEAGARHFLEHGGSYTPITAAIEEIRRGKVRIEILPGEEPEQEEAQEAEETSPGQDESTGDDATEAAAE